MAELAKGLHYTGGEKEVQSRDHEGRQPVQIPC